MNNGFSDACQAQKTPNITFFGPLRLKMVFTNSTRWMCWLSVGLGGIVSPKHRIRIVCLWVGTGFRFRKSLNRNIWFVCTLNSEYFQFAPWQAMANTPSICSLESWLWACQTILCVEPISICHLNLFPFRCERTIKRNGKCRRTHNTHDQHNFMLYAVYNLQANGKIRIGTAHEKCTPVTWALRIA